MAKFSNQALEVQDLKKSTEELKKANEKLEEKLEEQTNRGLRNTLIFKNIDERNDEKRKDTTEKVATAFYKKRPQKTLKWQLLKKTVQIFCLITFCVFVFSKNILAYHEFRKSENGM